MILRRTLQNVLIFLFVSTFFLILAAGIWKMQQPTKVQTNPPSKQAAQPPRPPVNTPAPTPTPTPTPKAISTATTGDAYRTPWGPVRVSIKATAGTLSDVQFIEIPDSPPSQFAGPQLVDQAIQAGAADIQGVSGATYTSLAFVHSLESALAKLKL